jgi:hypothetical protein
MSAPSLPALSAASGRVAALCGSLGRVLPGGREERPLLLEGHAQIAGAEDKEIELLLANSGV